LVAEAGTAMEFLIRSILPAADIPLTEVIAVLAQVVAVLKEGTCQFFPALMSFIITVCSQGDSEDVAQICRLIAALVTSIPDQVSGDLPAIFETIHSSFREPLPTPESYPNLLRSLASILREISSSVPADQLELCLAQYITAGNQPFSAKDEVEIDHANLMYQSIFKGLGALIVVAHRNEEWLTDHTADWFAHGVRFVRDFCLVMTDETFDDYVSFVEDAVSHLPQSCWPLIGQVGVRIPVIHAMLSPDLNVARHAMGVWNQMISLNLV
jgi:hypothetical protein